MLNGRRPYTAQLRVKELHARRRLRERLPAITSALRTASPVRLRPSKRHLEVVRHACELGPTIWLGRNPKSDAAVLADERTTRATSPKTRVVHQEIIEFALEATGASPGAANAHRFRVHPQISAGHRVVDPSGKE